MAALNSFFLHWYKCISEGEKFFPSFPKAKTPNTQRVLRRQRIQLLKLIDSTQKPVKHGMFNEVTECDGCYPKTNKSVHKKRRTKLQDVIDKNCMVFRCTSKDKTLKGGRLITSRYKKGAESLENCAPIFYKYVQMQGIIGSDGCGVCKSNFVQENWVPMFSNHSKNKWVKYSNWRTNKDCQGGDEATENTFIRFRKWISDKKGMSHSYVQEQLPSFLFEDDFYSRHTNGKANDVITTVLQQLSIINQLQIQTNKT